jgi:hypothetical protein
MCFFEATGGYPGMIPYAPAVLSMRRGDASPSHGDLANKINGLTTALENSIAAGFIRPTSCLPFVCRAFSDG